MFRLLIFIVSCSSDKDKKIVEKENVEFEYLVTCIQEINQRLEKDNAKLSLKKSDKDHKIVEENSLNTASRKENTKKRDGAKDEKYELQGEVVVKAN